MDTVLILIASTGRADGDEQCLDQSLLGAVAERAGIAGDPRWLAPEVACEWPLSLAPRDRRPLEDRLRAILAGRLIDVAVIPAANRCKRLLMADMDGTLIRQECIDELAFMAGKGEAIAAITARAMRGELDFEEALRSRVSMLKGLPAEAIDRVIAERLVFTEGGGTLVRTMRARGSTTALVSGGFTAFTTHVAARLGFEHARGNELVIAHGHLSGTVVEPILGRDAKRQALVELCLLNAITPDDAIAVGDGANDIPMLAAAGLGVAFHARPAARDAAAARIDHGDLTALLYLQGYTIEEFQG